MVDLEKLLGKKKTEIPFYEDTKRIINFAKQEDQKKFMKLLPAIIGLLHN